MTLNYLIVLFNLVQCLMDTITVNAAVPGTPLNTVSLQH